jgi:deoxyribodipyrimidine photolyase
VDAVFANHDYEPQAIARDATVAAALTRDARLWFSFKDQVIFEKTKSSQSQRPSVFTPYKNAWLKKMRAEPGCLAPFDIEPHAAPGATAHGAPARPASWQNWASSRATWPNWRFRPACRAPASCSRISCRARPAMTWRATFPP